VVAAVVLVAVVACSCGPSVVAQRGASHGRAAAEVAPAPLTAAENAAASAATAAFRNELGNESAQFVADVGRLQADLQAGDTAGAQTDELAAQSEFDQFREVAAGSNPINASTIDELAADVGPGQSFGGLHAVERDLWDPSAPAFPAPTNGGDAGTGGDALSQAGGDANGLAAQAPVAEYLLSKDALGPEAIGTTGVDDLNWVEATAIPEREERYSHLDAVDIAAGIGAARATFTTLLPLAEMVAPTLAATVDRGFTTMVTGVATLGPPDATPDASLAPAALLSLSQQADATAAEYARLSAALAPFGTEGGTSS
jgi:iron uptake system component EfeO